MTLALSKSMASNFKQRHYHLTASIAVVAGAQVARRLRLSVKLDQLAPRIALSEAFAHGVSLSLMGNRRELERYPSALNRFWILESAEI